VEKDKELFSPLAFFILRACESPKKNRRGGDWITRKSQTRLRFRRGRDEGRKPPAFFREVICDPLKIGIGFPFPQAVLGLTDTQKKEVQS
jgi:hypothetical protein